MLHQGKPREWGDFTGANLEGANFGGADLTNVNFKSAVLSKANFEAVTEGASFVNRHKNGEEAEVVRIPDPRNRSPPNKLKRKQMQLQFQTF